MLDLRQFKLPAFEPHIAHLSFIKQTCTDMITRNHVKLAAFVPNWHERCELDMIIYYKNITYQLEFIHHFLKTYSRHTSCE